MTITEAIVAIFGMLFFVITMGIVSHHNLEHRRIDAGKYSYCEEEEEENGPQS